MVNLVHFYDRPGGIEVLMPGIIRGIKGREFRVFVVRPREGDNPSVYKGMEQLITYGSKSNFLALIRLMRYARKRRKEIFHLFNMGPVFLLSLRWVGVKRVVYSIHGTVYWHSRAGKFVMKVLWRLALSGKSPAFTSNSLYSGDVFRREISPRTECRLLYNFIDTVRFKADNVSVNSIEVRKVIYSGRLVRGKGIERWIETAIAVHRVMPIVRFEIYGDGPLRENLNSIIADNAMEGIISLKGHSDAIEEVYRSADILLFLSEKESFGNVAVESILCGTPVVVSDIPSMREIFMNFPDFLVQNDEKLFENVIAKFRDIDRLRKLTVKAREEFADRFSPEAHMTNLGTIYCDTYARRD